MFYGCEFLTFTFLFGRNNKPLSRRPLIIDITKSRWGLYCGGARALFFFYSVCALAMLILISVEILFMYIIRKLALCTFQLSISSRVVARVLKALDILRGRITCVLIFLTYPSIFQKAQNLKKPCGVAVCWGDASAHIGRI